MTLKRKFAAASAAMFLLVLSLPAMAGVIDERQANFKKSNASIRAAVSALREGDFDAVARHVEHIANWAEEMSDYFPEGSRVGTDASLAIWSDFAGFERAADANRDAALELIAAARARDASAAQMALRAVSGSCKACHRRFRER